MKFENLLQVKFDTVSGKVDIESLYNLLPETPKDVLVQFYSEHGRNEDFQEQYSDIDIMALSWNLITVSSGEVVTCEMYEDFRRWYNCSADRVIRGFKDNRWNCIDEREEVVAHWSHECTWLTPPVFLHKDILCSKNIHLVEGHTRVGILCGLLCSGIIAESHKHKIWMAEMVYL